MTTSDPAVQPPFCEIHGCRGRWDADQPHTLCGKTTSTTAACRHCGEPTKNAAHTECNRCAARLPGSVACEGPFVNVTKISHMVPISREMAMDYGLIPDDRPAPPPPTRRQRFRWWRQERVRRARMNAASWIAGFDVEDSW